MSQKYQMFFKLIAIILICLLEVSEPLQEFATDSFCEFKSDGLYGHKEQCSKYIACSNGNPSIMPCPKGLSFDSTRLVCDEPLKVKNTACDNKEEIHYHDNNIIVSVTADDEITDGICDSKKDGLYSHKKHCSKYIACANGNSNIMPCPKGLWFDSIKLICEHPFKTKNPVCDKENNIDTNRLAGFCYGRESRLYPHKSDCSKYISCLNGLTNIMPCPKGLWFDAKQNVCNFPDNVFNPECIDPKKKSDKFTDSICEDKVAGKYEYLKSCTTFITCDGFGHGKLEKCAPHSNFDPLYKSCVWEKIYPCQGKRENKLFSTTTSSYSTNTIINASTSVSNATTTPTFLLTNVTTNTTEMVNKSTSMPLISNTTTSTTNLTILITNNTKVATAITPMKRLATTISTSRISPTMIEPTAINRTTSENLTTTVADKNTIAATNTTITKPTTTMMTNAITPTFNERTTSSKVNNTSNITTTAPSTSLVTRKPSIMSTAPSRTVTSTATEKITTYQPPKEFCLNKKTGPYPDPLRCDGYIVCVSQKGVFVKCPNGLLYNTVIGICDRAGNVNCTPVTVKPTVQTNSTNQTTTREVITTNTPVVFTSNKLTTTTYTPSKSFCDGRKNGNHPDPSRCDGFIACFHGQGIFMKCPAGLFYNETQDACDWPDNVNCARGTSTPTNQAKRSHAPTNTTNSNASKPNVIVTSSPNNYSTIIFHTTSSTSLNATAIPTTNSTITDNATTTYQPLSNFCEGKKNGNYPDLSRCDGFVACFHGHGLFMKCPAGLFYNETQDACDWPDNVKCTKETSKPTSLRATTTSLLKTTSTKIHTISPINTTAIPSIDSNNTDETATYEKEGFSCGSRKGSYSSPTECNKFYDCDGKSDTPILMLCPKHTNFHPVLRSCVYAYSYSCEDPTFCNEKPDGKYRNKNNCYGYYECIAGQTFPKNCDSGWRFNGIKCVTSVEYTCV